MEHNRKQKLLVIFALIIGIASLSIGFAAFSVSLNISSSANVSPNSDTFSVKFSTEQNSLVASDVVPSSITSGITATNGKINNKFNPTITNLSATFTEPGQYVEYTFYARNEGEYTAYLNSINFIGTNTCEASDNATSSLVEQACDSIYTIVYLGDEQEAYYSTTEISNHQLNKQTGEKITLRIEYAYDGARADGPFNITFQDISFIYSTINDPTFVPETKVLKPTIISGNIDTVGSEIALDTEHFYVIGQENNKVKLLAMYNLYIGNTVDKDWNVTPLSNPTGMQDSSAKGYNYDIANKKALFPYIATTAFSSDSQKGTNYTDYDGSIVNQYVEEYSTYLFQLGVNLSDARLITRTELEKLGCSCSDYSCASAPAWVYSTTYWTGTPIDTSLLWVVQTNSTIMDRSYDKNNTMGVRPVIEIPISEFE
ncbi:MAG: hypothetical protein J6C28_00605 [Bacilli bacterium]|nr:hypothetical protein [Bacilli bacterium]